MSECNICYAELDKTIRYQLEKDGEIYTSTKICDECLQILVETQNEEFKFFVTRITSLQECSKMLKGLLDGFYGIPTCILDLKIFPHPERKSVPNFIDPVFGRRNEVFKLWIDDTEMTSTLVDAPKTLIEVRNVLKEIISILENKLRDYDGEEIDSISTNLANLKCRI